MVHDSRSTTPEYNTKPCFYYFLILRIPVHLLRSFHFTHVPQGSLDTSQVNPTDHLTYVRSSTSTESSDTPFRSTSNHQSHDRTRPLSLLSSRFSLKGHPSGLPVPHKLRKSYSVFPLVPPCLLTLSALFSVASRSPHRSVFP